MNGFEPFHPENSLAQVRLEISSFGDVDVICPIGQIDFMQIPSARIQIEDLIRRGHVKLVLDMSQCDYMASSTVGMLLKKANELRITGGELKLASVPRRIMSVLALLGVEDSFRVYPSADEAVASF